jgi:hypothetical protein
MDKRNGRGALILAAILAAIAVLSLPGVAARSEEEEKKPLKVIRVVCTDHICGNCDGRCHRDSGHVAIDKRGHCACTPTEGSELDRATRDAYRKNQPG